MRVLLFPALCALAMPAAAQDTGSLIDPPVITPDMRVYTRADIPPNYKGDYPEAATKADVEGKVVVDCQLGDDLGPVKCIVEQESPAGYGFGEMTALDMLKYAHIKDSSAGSWHRLTFLWQAP